MFSSDISSDLTRSYLTRDSFYRHYGCEGHVPRNSSADCRVQ